MKPTLIMITGALAAMKSTFAEALSGHLKCQVFRKDDAKEIMVDAMGDVTALQKKKCSIAAVHLIHHYALQALKTDHVVIIEANFKSDEQIRIDRLCETFNYTLMVIELTATFDCLYARYLARETSRHRAHQSVNPMSEEAFKAMINEHSAIHATLRFDTTHWLDVGYSQELETVRTRIHR